MRVLLVRPDAPPTAGFRAVALPEPLHLEMMAALAPACKVRIFDTRLDDDLEAARRSFGPPIVAITTLIPEVYAAQQVLQQVQSFSAELLPVLGGHHATLVPKDFFLPRIDAIAVGEAEVMFREPVANRQHRAGHFG